MGIAWVSVGEMSYVIVGVGVGVAWVSIGERVK